MYAFFLFARFHFLLVSLLVCCYVDQIKKKKKRKNFFQMQGKKIIIIWQHVIRNYSLCVSRAFIIRLNVLFSIIITSPRQWNRKVEKKRTKNQHQHVLIHFSYYYNILFFFFFFLIHFKYCVFILFSHLCDLFITMHVLLVAFHLLNEINKIKRNMIKMF